MGCATSVSSAVQEVDESILHAFESEYELCESIGKGSFGQVFAAVERSTGEESAVKVLPAARGNQEEKAKSEISTWRAVGDHPSVVQLRSTFVGRGIAYMVMERCECTISQKLMASPSLLKGPSLPPMLREMLLGVEACHRVQIVHRDIKLDNFLMVQQPKEPHGTSVKLCDFGLAARLPPNGGLRGECGTAPMMSPEMLQGSEYDYKTDVWSYAATAYFMVFHELPYVPAKLTAEAAKQATRSAKAEPRMLRQKSSVPAAVFLRPLLERDPAARASSMEALELPFLDCGEKAVDFHRVDTQSTLAPMDLDNVNLGRNSEESDFDAIQM